MPPNHEKSQVDDFGPVNSETSMVGNLLDNRKLEQRDEGAVGDGGMCTQHMRRARYRQNCSKSFEIESGASQAAT